MRFETGSILEKTFKVVTTALPELSLDTPHKIVVNLRCEILEILVWLTGHGIKGCRTLLEIDFAERGSRRG